MQMQCNSIDDRRLILISTSIDRFAFALIYLMMNNVKSIYVLVKFKTTDALN